MAIGIGLLLLGAWLALAWWRRRDLPRTRWFLWLTVAAAMRRPACGSAWSWCWRLADLRHRDVLDLLPAVFESVASPSTSR
jgi:cytochrome bd-type quinol oxidase subunit 1